MSRRDDDRRLQHMLDHAREAVALTAGRAPTDIDQDRVLCLALVRLLEIVGEAAARVTEETQAKHPAIPWPQIIGLRNRLIYGYDSVDKGILWQVLTDDLPRLIEALWAIPGLEPND